MTQETRPTSSSASAAITCFVIGLIGYGTCCALLGRGLQCETISDAVPWLLASVLVGVITTFAIRLIDSDQAVIRHERQLKAEADYEVATAQPQLHVPQLPSPSTTNTQRPMSLPEPSRLVQVNGNQLVAVTPTDDQRIEALAQAILMRCFSSNPSQANIEARIPLRPEGLLRSHSDITMAMQKLFAMGWVAKESTAKTARWLWRDRQHGNELIDFDRPTTSLSQR